MPVPPPMRIMPGLDEPLVATGDVTPEENKDLDAALAAFHDAPVKVDASSDFSDYGKPLIAFLDAHPKSNWNAALLTNIGFGYYHAGYFSKAFLAWQGAWDQGRNATSPQARLMVDRAVGEIARMHARVGHRKELEALFADIGQRPIGGPATETIQGAHEGLWNFKNDPGISYLCGPMALKNVLIALKATPKQIKIAEDARSGAQGVSLTELAALADKTKLKYSLIHRESGQPIPVPSVINWNIHHYAAIVKQQGDHYLIIDPTFGNGGVLDVTRKAIDAESSGYFLVPAKVAALYPKTGWRTVAARSPEAQAVYGMGSTTNNVPGEVMCASCSMNSTQADAPAPHIGMPATNAHTMVVSLSLSDTPIGYKPQKGPSAYTSLYYNQREANQPATFGYSNLGPKWTINWLSFVQETIGSTFGMPITYVPGGGGGYAYAYSPGAPPALPELWSNTKLVRIPVAGTSTSYERHLPDGSKEVFTKFDGATSGLRNDFITQRTDPQGNTLTFNYDSTLRITSVVDAMGRSTTFTYGLTLYPLLITQITDPFGRYAQFTYDTSGRLSTVTDALGITSTFTYSTTEPTFITTLTTPYGTSTFSDAVDPNDTVESNTRSLTLTDPLGYTDYLYYYPNYTIIPAYDPASTLPTGMSPGVYNGLQQYRNMFYWDKHAFALGCTMTSGVVTAHDYTKAFLTHWIHDTNTGTNTGDVPESVKPPLENRIWFNYPGQGTTYAGGTLNKQTSVARVLDNGTTQISKATYTQPNPFGGLPLSATDAKGRATKYTYATNNIDLLTVQQLTTTPSTYTTIGTYGSYNTLHEPQTYTGADGQVWHMTYNAAGQRATITDPNSGVTTFNYDASARLSTVQNANLVTAVTYTYDSADRIRTRTDSEGYVLTYDYDNLDRITKITYPDGTTDLNDYNFQSGPNVGTPSLELRKHTDRLGRVTTWDFDANRRLTSVTEPVAGTTTRTTSYVYYEDGTLKEITDANGNVTHWNIDIESRSTSKIYAYGTAVAKTETYTYENTTSRLKSITDALGQVKTFTYGLDDRITAIAYTSTVNPTPGVTFAYDTYFPRLTSMVDGLGTTTYGYTAIGTSGALKLSSIDGPYSNDVLGLTYDTLGRLAGRTITGGNETFGYDAINRLTTHVTPLGSFTNTYLGQTAQQASRSVTVGAVTTSTSWGYDTNTNDRRLISIANSGVTRSYTLGYGTTPVNPYDIMSITDTAAATHPWATQSHAYSYDDADRALTASATTPGNFAYAYDKLDNATSVTTPSGAISPAPAYNGLNQLAAWASNTYAYDNNGNTLSGDGLKTYKWDAENRLIEIDYVGTSNKSVFSYDGAGHRTVDAETVSGVTTTTRYLWCGDTICQTRDGSDTVLRRDLDEGEYNVTTGQKLLYMPDQLGSVRDVLDATTGNLVQSYDFTPYGAIAQTNGSTPTDYQYAGLFYHVPSGLNLATYRTLDGITGRFLNRDPIREAGGINQYMYTGANPLNRIDPDGLIEITIPIEEPWFTWPTVSPMARPTTIDPAGAVPLPTTGDPNNDKNNCDPCKGLLDQLQEHEKKLADYKANPSAYDNKGFLGQGRDEQVIRTRITKLEKSIENFRSQYYACLIKHGAI